MSGADNLEVVAPHRHVTQLHFAATEHAPHRRGGRVAADGELAGSPVVQETVDAILGPTNRLVRSILFDKVPGSNWSLRWHQDRTIAVIRRVDVPGYGPWSVKAGIVSVHPPVEVLERMITVRIHLDPCTKENGALRVIPGSAASGKLGSDEVADRVARGPEIVCETPAGGALLMRPLTLHASGPTRSSGHRRILHLDFASGALGGRLQWNPAA